MRACPLAVHLLAGALLAGALSFAQAQERVVIDPRSDPRLRPLPLDRTGQPPAQNPRCAELIEAIRAGAAKGADRSTLLGMSDAYRQQCGDEAARAKSLPLEERNRQREVREREERTARLELDRDKLNREQCAEMKRILQSKRQRLETMTPGERGDFERFEATWKARCQP